MTFVRAYSRAMRTIIQLGASEVFVRLAEAFGWFEWTDEQEKYAFMAFLIVVTVVQNTLEEFFGKTLFESHRAAGPSSVPEATAPTFRP